MGHMVPLFEYGTDKNHGPRIVVDIPPLDQLVSETQEIDIEVIGELAKLAADKTALKKMSCSIGLYRSDSSESIIKNFGSVEEDFFHTRPVLLITDAPKELRKRLPKVTRHEEEYHFLDGSSQASFVTTNQEGKEVVVIPSYRLEVGILTGAIPCENVKDGKLIKKDREQDFIPQEEIFPIVAQTFPLPQGQLDYLAKMYAKKTS